MNTIFMNSRNRKTSDPPRLLLNLSDKTDDMLLYQILVFTYLVFYMVKYKKLYKNNLFEISAPA